jgi:chemotaxis protein CheD
MTPAAASVIVAPAEKRRHYLHTGHLLVSSEPAVMITVVGSCIAVCLWDERLEIGGMNHFLLPHRIAAHHPAFRFGTLATTELVDRLVALGSRPKDLRAKVFGGASMLVPGVTGAIGAKNTEVAAQVLSERQIAVVANSTGGNRGRKIVFHTDTGETLVRVV